MCRYASNRHRKNPPLWPVADSAAFEADDIADVHRSLPKYRPTPLVDLPGLAAELGVKRIFVKDESHRFGLKAFKALGAAYAIFKLTEDKFAAEGKALKPERLYGSNSVLPPEIFTFCTATDGNHGRGVAWVARKLNQRAVIYMPSASVEARVDNIRSEGAEVVVVDGSYDDALARAIRDAGMHGWQIVSDTSWPGYEAIPRWIQAGYRTLFEEVDTALAEQNLDVVLVPGGVGALAATAAWYFNRPGRSGRPKLVCVEPTEAACLYESNLTPDGSPTSARGNLQTIMAGLNCGTVSPVAWPWIRDGFDGFLIIDDRYAELAMRRYYHPSGHDTRIVSGESGAATLGGLLALQKESDLRQFGTDLGLGPESAVLLLNTEGDTDPVGFKRVVQGLN